MTISIPGNISKDSIAAVVEALIDMDAARDTSNRLLVNSKIDKSQGPTYGVVGTGYGGYASATDMLTLKNPAASGKVLRLEFMSMWCRQTSGALALFNHIKRSTLNTGGTATQPTVFKHDSSDAAPVGVVDLYSAVPTTGTAVFTLPQYINITALTAVPAQTSNILAGGLTPQALLFSKPITLRPSECYSINFAGASPASGFDAYYLVLWSEESE